MRTAFVADSTLGLTPNEALNQNIHLVPQIAIIDGVSYRDHLEITAEQIYEAQRAGKKVGTSQVSPADFTETYEKLLQQHDRVVSVHVSSKLSGTVATAKMVAEKFGDRILVLDSLSINAGLGFVLEEARRKLEAGVSWQKLDEAIGPLRDKVRGYVVPDTLTFLARSGRISGLQAFVGNLLKLIPILEVNYGRVSAMDRVRGYQKGLEAVISHLQKQFPQGGRVVLAHADNLKAIDKLKGLLPVPAFELQDVRECGAAVSAHTGPGTVALFAAPR